MQTNSENEKRISYSEFKNWVECPYRHKLVYIDKLPYYSGNEFTAFGTAIHEACETALPSPESDIYSIFEEAFLKELNILKEEGHEFDKSLVMEMRKQAEPICAEISKSVKEYFGDFEIFSIEEKLMQPITDIDAYGRKFKGFIDLVLKTPNGKYHIIDWKSCSWGWNMKKKTDKIINYQLTYYKNYFSKKHNIDPNNIETYFALLKRTAKRDRVEIFRVSSGRKKTENSLKILQNAVINIERRNFIKNRLSCKYCKFKDTEYCT